MSDLISKKALLEAYTSYNYIPSHEWVIDLINSAPAVSGDAVAYQYQQDVSGHGQVVTELSLFRNSNLEYEGSKWIFNPLFTYPPQPQSVKDALEKAVRNGVIDEVLTRLRELENSTTNDYHGLIGYCSINIRELKDK